MKSFRPIQINLLGPMEIRRGKLSVELPSSKKARAILAYLIANGRQHRRDRLTDLLWDVADDPKGGLRWCLSKIRPLVDEPQRPRILADRETVEFRLEDAQVDYLIVRESLEKGTSPLHLKELQDLASLFRGSFLEGLELPDYDRFQAWLIAEREDALRLQVSILRAIVQELAADPDRAIPWARQLVERDPFDDHSRVLLSDFLSTAGRHAEARQLLDHGKRLASELGAGGSGVLEQTERGLSRLAPVAPGSQAPVENLPQREPRTAMIGREREFAHVRSLIEHSRDNRRGHVVLITGEPGVGKSRLLSELAARVSSGGGAVLLGRSYEAEARRPYGPWIDAIQSVHPSLIGEVLRDTLAPLLIGVLQDEQKQGGRERLFAAVVELLAARAHSAPPVLLQFDDIQWCDEASAELLHYAVRMTRHRPVFVVLAARSGELPDNPSVMRVLRGFRREGWIEELGLDPLSRDDTAKLIRTIYASANTDAVFDETAGNPLYAIELASAAEASAEIGETTLAGLIRDRIDRLPAQACDLLKWVAVLGSKFNLNRLESLTSLSTDELANAVETLERHGLLRNYSFTHNVVQRAVYDDLSEPRRRLMHRRIAQMFEREVSSPGMAAEVAHHAALAGDTAAAARASVAAGRYCLRLYANAEAQAFARSGMRYSEALPEAQRTSLQIDLMEVSLSAGRPKDVEETARLLEDLAEKALFQGDVEHARLGFHLLSYLRWEGGDWSNARRHSLRAEVVARRGDAREQVVAMAEAARCLALLERDLGQAEALALEARARAASAGVNTVAIPDALGMLRFHQGSWDDAASLFHAARELSLREGDHIGEFRALEHLVVLELERNNPDAAKAACRDLAALASKLREGSEAPFARCLSALAAEAAGENVAKEIDAALESLRMADAKHRLAYALLRATYGDLARNDAAKARARGEEALRLAEALGRPSETAMAHVVLLRCALLRNARKDIERHQDALRDANMPQLAAYVRRAAEKYLPREKGALIGTRSR